MTALRIFLIVSWVIIMGITLYAVIRLGFNWPAVFFGDLVSHSWRAQFNTDFLIHLFLLCGWIYWREASKVKGAIYGFLSIFLGGMFGFAYLVIATYKAKGNMDAVLLGSHFNPVKD